MRETEISTTTQTCQTDRGHVEPLMPVKISLTDQGIAINPGLTPGHDFAPDGDRTPDIYLERRPSGWAILISPDSGDIRVSVTIFDTGVITVLDSKGNQVLEEDEPIV